MDKPFIPRSMPHLAELIEAMESRFRIDAALGEGLDHDSFRFDSYPRSEAGDAQLFVSLFSASMRVGQGGKPVWCFYSLGRQAEIDLTPDGEKPPFRHPYVADSDAAIIAAIYATSIRFRLALRRLHQLTTSTAVWREGEAKTCFDHMAWASNGQKGTHLKKVLALAATMMDTFELPEPEDEPTDDAKPEPVTNAADALLDGIARFVSECTRRDPDHATAVDLLYQAFLATGNGVYFAVDPQGNAPTLNDFRWGLPQIDYPLRSLPNEGGGATDCLAGVSLLDEFMPPEIQSPTDSKGVSPPEKTTPEKSEGKKSEANDSGVKNAATHEAPARGKREVRDFLSDVAATDHNASDDDHNAETAQTKDIPAPANLHDDTDDDDVPPPWYTHA
ncbi:MAG: hypothetical protein O3A46_08850 [Candidatus Poribacteria bacterium]|nr:hypothetical protein [Candidatus Poribacteria bacterium]